MTVLGVELEVAIATNGTYYVWSTCRLPDGFVKENWAKPDQGGWSSEDEARERFLTSPVPENLVLDYARRNPDTAPEEALARLAELDKTFRFERWARAVVHDRGLGGARDITSRRDAITGERLDPHPQRVWRTEDEDR